MDFSVGEPEKVFGLLTLTLLVLVVLSISTKTNSHSPTQIIRHLVTLVIAILCISSLVWTWSNFGDQFAQSVKSKWEKIQTANIEWPVRVKEKVVEPLPLPEGCHHLPETERRFYIPSTTDSYCIVFERSGQMANLECQVGMSCTHRLAFKPMEALGYTYHTKKQHVFRAIYRAYTDSGLKMIRYLHQPGCADMLCADFWSHRKNDWFDFHGGYTMIFTAMIENLAVITTQRPARSK